MKESTNLAINFAMQRLAEKTTWAAIFGVLSGFGLYVGVADNDALITSISAVAGFLSGVVAILTKENKGAE